MTRGNLGSTTVLGDAFSISVKCERHLHFLVVLWNVSRQSGYGEVGSSFGLLEHSVVASPYYFFILLQHTECCTASARGGDLHLLALPLHGCAKSLAAS